MIKLVISSRVGPGLKPVFMRPNGWVVPYPAGLKQLRKERKWSVQDIANKTGASPRTVEGWEQGRHIPPKPALLLLMAAMKEAGDEAKP